MCNFLATPAQLNLGGSLPRLTHMDVFKFPSLNSSKTQLIGFATNQQSAILIQHSARE